MIRADVIYLIHTETHGVFEAPTEKKKRVYCEVRSVGMNEFYRAMEHGIEPTYVFTLADYADYDGEKLVEYHGKRYRVVRVYFDDHSVELTVEEETHHVN